MARPRIGELLLEARVITRERLEEAIKAKGQDTRKIGQILIEMGAATETQLTQALSQQLSVPWVSLYHIDFSRQLLNRVPREVAERFCLVPIYVRHVRKQGDTLYVAMDDPTNLDALAEVEKSASLPVRPMIACASDIRSAIRVYYVGDGGEPRAATADVAEPAPKIIAKPAPPEKPAPPPVSGPPAARVAAPSAPPVDAPRRREDRESGPPSDRPKIVPGMIAMTLLDGTTIQLPGRRPRVTERTSGEHELTARDLVSALRAVAQGHDASQILGEKVPIEALCAALISILLKKGLVADWEFVEELRKV